MGLALIHGVQSAVAASVEIVVGHRAGSDPLLLDSLRYRNRAGEDWSVTRLSYLVSGVSLQREDGSWFEVPDSVAWMDATTRRQTMIQSGIPSGKYQAMRFHIGISPSDNATDPVTRSPDHPLNPNVCGLHWSWQGGYIFMALEGLHRTGDAQPEGYAFHLARDPFRTEVVLKLDLDLRDRAIIPVNFDVTALLDGMKNISFAKDGTTTHSRDGDPLALTLKENLARAFSISPQLKIAAQKTKAEPKLKPLYLPKTFTPFKFTMGATFPMPALPNDNPLFNERVELGRLLFHETALSRDGSISCASCHEQAAGLSDPRRFSVGVEGRTGDRNAMPLFNLAWKREFFWDGRSPSLREQVLVPIQDHREMDETLVNVVAKLGKIGKYPAAFERAFGSTEITPEKIGLAVENFLLTLTSHNSKFDRAMRGEEKLSDDEKRGFELFMTEREPRMGSMGGDCFHCHGGALFTDHQFRNNGLKISDSDLGRARFTNSRIDRGAFATPSLRNIALTAPYMHDGRFNTLEEVLEHYSEGVSRTETLDPNLAKHPDGGLHLSADDKKALISFLRTLTDQSLEPH
jgi:cytochrome c peroxidase